MDRNSAIGLTLIAVLLLVYFNFFSSPPDKTPKKPTEVTTTDIGRPDSLSAKPGVSANDSLIAKQYGSFSTFLTGDEVLTKIETKDLVVTLSNQAIVQQVELRNFKTYTQQPLLLAAPKTNAYSLHAILDGKDIDLYRLFYKVTSAKVKDTTVVTFTADLSAGVYIRHVYTIPQEGFEIGYNLEAHGLEDKLNGKGLDFSWTDHIALQEKDVIDSRGKTTINYYLATQEFDGISESAVAESETLKAPVKWVAIRQKFFISSILADHAFSTGDVAVNTDPQDSLIVKTGTVKLTIPKEDVLAHQASFHWYFGPNDYEIIRDVAPGFSRNLYLGWPPVIWVNKFVIIPIFKFLERFVSNYGLIIVMLVLIIKLLLTPLTYSSYVGMAKMKILKPELDAMKEKNGDNMAQNQQDQLKLYQQAGVNPFSGCIPLLLQMPILFSMLYFFPMSIDLRQKHFLWAEDLSTYDSIATLPFAIPFYGSHVSLFVLLMTVSTLVYTWQNNQLSSVQGPMKSMSYFMPVIFLFVLNKFSAGLSFYYFVANLVTFAQQAIIRRFVDDSKIKLIMEENKKKAATAVPGKKSSFMNRIESAMKASEEAKKAKR